MAGAVGRLKAALADRYAIEREIGSGGMATVYLAHDVRHDRDVALKVLRPELASALGPERFLHEIKIAARLQHPHILPLHDSGEVDGFLYYVMPYVEGESLRDKLRREGELPVTDAVRILRDVVDALAKAHSQGVVHRDIKPDNVMLSGRHALVTDFGVAKAVSEATGRAQLTTAGVALGTPAYMAPEQAAADPHIDHRADIYAVGALGYEMLTGRPPFTGATPQQVLSAHVTEAPKPVTQHRPAVPPQLAQLVMRCLEKKPADRWQSAEELLPQLESLSTPSLGVTPTEISTVAAVSDKSIAVLPFLNVGGDPENEYFSDGLAEDIIDALTQVAGLRVMARTSSFAFRGKEADVREIGARLNVEHILEGSVRRAGNRLRVTAQLVKVSDGYHLWSQRFDREMTDVFAIQDEISQAIVEKLRVRLSADRPLVKRYTENLAAYDLCLKARYHILKLTHEGREAGRRYCEQAIALDPNYALAHVVLAESYFWDGFWGSTDPRQGFSRAKLAALEALRLDDTIAEAHSVLGGVLGSGEFDWRGAEREFLRAQELSLPSAASGYDYAWYFGMYFLLPLGRGEEAFTEIRHALERDPLDPFYNSLAGYLLFALRQFEPAASQLRHTIDLDPTFFFAHWFLSILYAREERIDEAIRASEKANELSGGTAITMGDLGKVYALAGRTAEARQLLEELTERRQSSYVPASAFLFIHTGLGEREEALEWMARGVDEHDPIIMTSLRVSPSYDRLRSQPAYLALLRKMNLEP